jgi:hypothetical protein
LGFERGTPDTNLHKYDPFNGTVECEAMKKVILSSWNMCYEVGINCCQLKTFNLLGNNISFFSPVKKDNASCYCGVVFWRNCLKNVNKSVLAY